MTIGDIVTSMLAVVVISASLTLYALSPVEYEDFYNKISYSPDVQPSVWNGRSDLCLKKAADTGYLMLWFISSRGDGYNCVDFLKNNICRQAFCDVVNNYGYLILCCDDYSSSVCKNLKDSAYGWVKGGKIYDANTGTTVDNHNGYPIKQRNGKDESGMPTFANCDPVPSLHLIKVDTNTNIIFHVCTREGVYDSQFSPYASKFPIPSNMCCMKDLFAPWLKQYLDMYPVTKQIETYENAGGDAQVTVTVNATNYEQSVQERYTYQAVNIAVTDTANPTVYQIALHRDNILFRMVTMLGDIIVKDRISDNFTGFDERSLARNWIGKWYLTYDDTISAIPSSTSDAVAIDVYTKVDCTLDVSQVLGTGFSVSGYEVVMETNITSQSVMTETGASIQVISTNIVATTAESPFMNVSIPRYVLLTTNVPANRIYRISSTGSSTFDVLSTK